jgi:hypothetical protein
MAHSPVIEIVPILLRALAQASSRAHALRRGEGSYTHQRGGAAHDRCCLSWGGTHVVLLGVALARQSEAPSSQAAPCRRQPPPPPPPRRPARPRRRRRRRRRTHDHLLHAHTQSSCISPCIAPAASHRTAAPASDRTAGTGVVARRSRSTVNSANAEMGSRLALGRMAPTLTRLLCACVLYSYELCPAPVHSICVHHAQCTCARHPLPCSARRTSLCRLSAVGC